jgi:DNA-dependent RNA polymerase auxiliary subunit epsilon
VASSNRGARLPVRLNRKSPSPSLAPFTEYFQGFERVEAVRAVFGDRTEKVLGGLKIGFIPNRGMYMGIRDYDGNIAVGSYHLRNSPTRTLYLDIVHELFHINQRMTDEAWFHAEFMKFMADRSLYYASPIEIPAYEHTVREAERIGMTPEEITEYLKMGEAPPRVWRRFLKEMKLGTKKPPGRKVTRFPVKIKRETKSDLHPFTDYFIGFEKVPAVRELLGESAASALAAMKVEFIDSPFPTIYPSEEDGHLIVANDYFRKGTVKSLYLDAFLGLSIVKELSSGGPGFDAEDDDWNSPGMIKAHASMVTEARRLGLSEAEIVEHLRLPGFLMSPAGYRKFLRALGLRPQ